MGALHAGHMALVQRSVKENDITVGSIFVNPAQFNNPADLEKYPRDIERDILMLHRNGCNILFYPGVKEMYPEGEKLPDIDLKGIDRRLEGEHRPGHFKGVATIVKKLFEVVTPDNAYFGSKDYQQVLVVKELVRQTALPVNIVAVDTVREESGLAMSSRNRRLGAEALKEAEVLYKALSHIKNHLGNKPLPVLVEDARSIISQVPGTDIEYFDVADAETLEPVTEYHPGQKLVALTAVNIGGVRLIDNMVVS